MQPEPRRELRERIDQIEESYEFMLAYAAQGLTSADEARAAGLQLRHYLDQLGHALTGFTDLLAQHIEKEESEAAKRFATFADVLDRDARAARAALRLVLAQPGISSQLVDNLNASIHLRALLTDLFLVDEILSEQAKNAPAH